MPKFRSAIEKFSSSLNRVISHQDLLPKSNKPAILDFSQKKRAYQLSLYQTAYRELIAAAGELDLMRTEDNKDVIYKIKSKMQRLKEEYDKGNLNALVTLTSELLDLDSKLIYSEQSQSASFRLPRLPSEISEDMNADVKELEKCFGAGCLRASVILCGRLLETALHRKYYEATKQDILEKSPGIGLGNLIAKMKEQNIPLDPAIAQQIHLINQVRIYSVHTKKEAFSPSKDQTHAIILYTLDVIRKLFTV